MAMNQRRIWYAHLVGWVLFTVSALLFTIDSIRNGAAVLTFASLAFLVACAFFLAPVLTDRPDRQ